MASRQAACEPCRKAKLACDHGRPACSRCKHHRRQGSCVYRSSPFIRRPALGLARHRDTPECASPLLADDRPRRYPNPGYLGPSSHVTIFSQIFTDRETPSATTLAVSSDASPAASANPDLLSLDRNPSAKQGAKAFEQLMKTYCLQSMEGLVTLWNQKGGNLALAEPFVALCAQFSNYSWMSSLESQEFGLQLLENTSRPLVFHSTTSLSDFTNQFLRDNTRWETLGIFLCSVLRATLDIPFFPTLYVTEAERHQFRYRLLRLAEHALEICLSLDCLNDLQHILAYENCMVYSFMSGAQSFHFWRRLGDVISSTFALGYHEDLDRNSDAPRFLTELRKTAFGRVYSADKNISLFLGRPLRLSKRFCHFQLPESRLPLDCASGTTTTQLEPLGHPEWGPDSPMNYRGETVWAALCASVKEDIMDLLFRRGPTDYRQRVDELQSTADSLWAALPTHFRVRTQTNTPFERDFVIIFRLNYLHIKFLLHRIMLEKLSEPNEHIIEVSAEILHLVVEVMIQHAELSNSGTTLSWKIAHFGLPAAGILLLALLNKGTSPPCLRLAKATILQDLAVLSAQVERGTLIRPGDPNYALLSRATQTIHRFLDFVISDEGQDGPNGASKLGSDSQEVDSWFPHLGIDLVDSEFVFWQGLADHPSLDVQCPLTTNEDPDDHETIQ